MSESNGKVKCSDHGEGVATYVCKHLASEPVQRWHGELPCLGNLWPDSWCDVCNRSFEREGEWNDANHGDVELAVLCHYCHDDARGQSVNRLVGDQLTKWREFVASCHGELDDKQDRLEDRFDLWKHRRWHWDQDRAEIVFSNDGIAAVIANITFAGSVSTRTNTWLWSWANSSLEPAVQGHVSRVRDFGEAADYPHLLVPRWSASEKDGWEMVAVATHVLGGDGAYRTPADYGSTFMVLSDVRFAQ